MYRPGMKVDRVQDQEPKGATVVEARGQSLLLAYDEGGTGWWLEEGVRQPVNAPRFQEFVADFYRSAAFAGLIEQRNADPSGVIDQRLLALKLEMAAAQAGDPSPALIQDAISRLVAVIQIGPEQGQEIATLMARHNLGALFEIKPTEGVGPDLKGFLGALVDTDLYTKKLGPALFSPEASGFGEPLSFLLTAMKNVIEGIRTPPSPTEPEMSLQKSIWGFMGVVNGLGILELADVAEVSALMDTYGLTDVYSLTPPTP